LHAVPIVMGEGYAAVARGILERMRAAVAAGVYHLTAHALHEMGDDDLQIWDLEAAILTGRLRGRQRGDPRGRWSTGGPPIGQAESARSADLQRLAACSSLPCTGSHPLKGKPMYDYRCEYCTGTVRPRTVEQEVFRHPRGFVMLEQVTIGVCDMCGNRYYSADLLHQVEELAAGRLAPERIESIPVSRAGSSAEP